MLSLMETTKSVSTDRDECEHLWMERGLGGKRDWFPEAELDEIQ